MKKILSVVLGGFMLMSCSAAHNAKVKHKITETYGNGDVTKKVVVKKKSEIEKSKPVVEKKSTKKPAHPLLEKEETETLVATSNVSVTKNTVEDYIHQYSGVAMQSMRTYGIPASIKLAQGILESGSGNGTLCRTANNHFGIKCKDEWTGETVSYTDDAPDECFRKYKTALESYNDHSEFLANRVYYKKLFTLDQDDYKAWAKGLKKAGYATDPRYPQKLIDIIERYRLYEYDEQVLGTHKSFDIQQNKKIMLAQNISSSYTVQPGDTLYAISRKFNSSVEKIKELNDLKSNDLSVGQNLRLQ